MARNPPWVRDELILALDLYFRVNPLHTSQHHPEIVALSKFLNKLPVHPDRLAEAVFRNPNGVYMKLCNYLRFDPSYHGKGLTRGGRLEKEIWDEFAGDHKRLRLVAKAIRNSAGAITPAAIYATVGSADEEFIEGRILTALHIRRERNPALVRKKKAAVLDRAGTLECEVCGFDFAKRYGNLGAGFAECHHKVAVSTLKPKSRVRLDDLAVLCANCHRMIHRSRPMLSVEQLTAMLQ